MSTIARLHPAKRYSEASVHNGIVYEQIDQKGSIPTKGRCCGHAAIPFGDAWGLQSRSGDTIPNILYYAHTPDPELPGTTRVRNGYALVTLHGDGGFTEAFYETGDAKPVYRRTWTAAELGLPLRTEPPAIPAA